MKNKEIFEKYFDSHGSKSNKDVMYGSTNVDKVCKTCGDKHELCVKCGDDLYMRSRRMFKPDVDTNG